MHYNQDWLNPVLRTQGDLVCLNTINRIHKDMCRSTTDLKETQVKTGLILMVDIK